MRRMIVAATVVALGLSASALAAPTDGPGGSAATARISGQEWCGFIDKAGSRVRCGYTSESACKQAVGDRDAVCIVDPYLTERRRLAAEG